MGHPLVRGRKVPKRQVRGPRAGLQLFTNLLAAKYVVDHRAHKMDVLVTDPERTNKEPLSLNKSQAAKANCNLLIAARDLDRLTVVASDLQ